MRFTVGAQILQATTGALGVDCAFVRCLVPPRPGERIALRFYLAGDHPVQVTATVRPRTGRETGTGFWADFVPEKSAHLRIARALGIVEESSRPMDRRATPRFAARFAVRFGSVDEFRREYATNISAGGLFIRTEEPPAMDTVVDVVLEIPGGEPIQGKGLVVHRVGSEEAVRRQVDPGIGVQFVHGDDRFRERIDQFVAALSARGNG
ncbi:MAG: TIGR02266 family protein [Myxococcales bacterium]